MAGVKGKYVRRYDSLGRRYVVPRGGGRRVKVALWKEERQQIARARKEGRKAVELGEVPPTGGPGEAPFPPSVMGVPVDERGVPRADVWVDEDGVEWDLPHAMDGDDDTGGK